MLIGLDEVIKLSKNKIRGVLHIGAHYGQEYAAYNAAGISNLIFFEPVRATFEKLVQSIPFYIDVINVALGNQTGEIDMFVETANQGMSSSVLEPGTHLQLYPGITFDRKERVQIEKLDNIAFHREDFNMINIDVQGYELEVFKGAVWTLKFVDVIYTEINTEEVYKGCALVEDIDTFLAGYGFERVVTEMPCAAWGDAIYIKK
jgi:FkbM family methyltransferase